MSAADAKLGQSPRVPYLGGARVVLWLTVAALSLAFAARPADLPALEARRDATGACVLSARSSDPLCACGELPADVRRVLGLPQSLARMSVEDLEGLPGIGPRRARAIVEERARRPFASVEELRRVRGIGPATLRSLAAQLFVGPDPACAAGPRAPHS